MHVEYHKVLLVSQMPVPRAMRLCWLRTVPLISTSQLASERFLLAETTNRLLAMVRRTFGARLCENVRSRLFSSIFTLPNQSLIKVATFLESFGGFSRTLLASSVTLPYYRFYRQNTLLPILAIARSVRNQDDDESISGHLRHWQDRKLDEFKFIAAAVLEP